ncbi:MAG: SPOR domain-containing protein [Nitrospirae bacterium]|nr:SPOR domain-containing protein [Nitrospirota bacterium]
MREIRKIRKRGITYRKKRRWVLPAAGVAAVVILAAGGYAYARWHLQPQETPLAPGMIYMAEKSSDAVPPALPAVEATTETPSEPEGIPSGEVSSEKEVQEEDGKGQRQGEKAGETQEKEDHFTFYKTLPAKNDPIVPLTPEKKKERENGPIYFPPNPSEKGAAAPSGKGGNDGKPPRGEFTVQVAALKDRGGAEELIHSLKNKGHEAYILDLPDRERGTLYRVRVGHYASRQEAQRGAERLMKEGLNTFVVKGD